MLAERVMVKTTSGTSNKSLKRESTGIPTPELSPASVTVAESSDLTDLKFALKALALI